MCLPVQICVCCWGESRGCNIYSRLKSKCEGTRLSGSQTTAATTLLIIDLTGADSKHMLTINPDQSKHAIIRSLRHGPA